MEVKNKVELADISEVLIQDFDEGLHELEDYQLVLVFIYDRDEVETSVSFVYYFVFLEVHEITHFGIAGDNQLVDLQ